MRINFTLLPSPCIIILFLTFHENFAFCTVFARLHCVNYFLLLLFDDDIIDNDKFIFITHPSLLSPGESFTKMIES